MCQYGWFSAAEVEKYVCKMFKKNMEISGVSVFPGKKRIRFIYAK